VHCWSTDFGTPSYPTTHRPTHFRRGSDQSIGTVQKIGHEEMINRGQRSIKQPFITSDREQMGETLQIQRRAAPPPSSTMPTNPPPISSAVTFSCIRSASAHHAQIGAHLHHGSMACTDRSKNLKPNLDSVVGS
ncbi:hypothetical protein ACLOJK_034829, partial [Asimina triloba]